jgi:hypothetical protein
MSKSIEWAKCRYCGKEFGAPDPYRKRKYTVKGEHTTSQSIQIITCKNCRGKLPKDDYIGKFL